MIRILEKDFCIFLDVQKYHKVNTFLFDNILTQSKQKIVK